MEKLRIAILDEQIAAQLNERGEELDGLDVVWSGLDVEGFRREVPVARPEALVVDLALLGADPVSEVEALMAGTGAQTLLVTYTFAKREVLEGLSEKRARPLRAPVSLESLRGFLSGVMVRKILGGAGGDAQRLAGALRPQSRATATVQPRYSMAQLGRLKEIESAVECECPANLADLLTQLVAFENYSANCENKNDKDAEVHHMLFKETGRARAIMEQALTHLIDHENIKL